MDDNITLFHALVRAQIELWNAVDARVRTDCGVPLGTIESLRVVSDRGGEARVGDIADDLVITVGAASKLVDRVVAAGHLSRRPNPDDRRSSLVALTAAGGRVLADGEAAIGDELTHRFGALSTTRRAALIAALADLRTVHA